MFEHGHSFDDIRQMNLEDLGIVLAVWRQKTRIDKKRARLKKNGRKKSLKG